MVSGKTLQFQLGGTLRLLVDEEPSKAGAFFTVTYERFQLRARGDGMAYTLPGDRQVQVQVSYVDANGHPAVVDGEVTWSSSNEDVAIAIPDTSDSTLCTVRPSTSVGSTQITATADADLGDGVRELVTFMDVTVIGGEAVAGTISPVGEPSPIPTPRK